MPEARVYQCPVCGAFAQEGERSCRHCSTALATLRCGSCFELSFPDDLRCRGCGHELGLEPVAQPSHLVCPDCKHQLKAFSDSNGTLHACEGCGGQLVSHGLLRALLESREILGSVAGSVVAAPRVNPLAQPVRYRPCPACQQMMNRKNFGSTSGIVIDICSNHGSFFDAGELPRVLEFVRRGGLLRAKAAGQAGPRHAPSPGLMQGVASPSEATVLDAFGVVDLFTFVVDVLTID
jgi:Zn-finger nucleic acid-binding protein